MTRDDILVLARAGFTAQQIAALSSVQVAQQTPAPQQIQQPVAEQPAQTAQPVAEQPQYDFEGLLSRLDGIQTAMQKNAILHSAMPENPDLRAEDILAEIINPKHKGEG